MNVPTALESEETVAQIHVGGVHRKVHRTQVLLDDAVELVFAGQRQCDVVAEEEAEAVVLVHEVEILAQPLRHLMDEAEHAVVAAGLELQRLELERFALERHARHAHLPLGTGLVPQGKFGFEAEDAVVVEIECVLDGIAVHGHQPIARPHAAREPLGYPHQLDARLAILALHAEAGVLVRSDDLRHDLPFLDGSF